MLPACWTGPTGPETSTSSGKWRPGSAGDAPIVEPATGEELGSHGTGRRRRRRDARPPRRPRLSRSGPRCRTRSGRGAAQGRRPVHASTATSSPSGTCARSVPSAGWRGSRCTSRPRSATPRGLPGAPLGELIPSEEPRLSMAKRVPVGVVGVISPFNVPLILSIRSVAPALALGNAVLLKPDPRTVVTGGVNIVRVFEEAGLPPGVLQLVPGGADIGEAMVTDPHVRVISFTGSTAAGRVGRRAGRPAPQARPPRARRQLRDARCSTTPTSRRRSTSRPGARSSTRARSA